MELSGLGGPFQPNTSCGSVVLWFCVSVSCCRGAPKHRDSQMYLSARPCLGVQKQLWSWAVALAGVNK